MKKENIFKPFKMWGENGEIVYGLCIKNGRLYNPAKVDCRDHSYEVWCIYYDKVLDMWSIEFSNHETLCNEVYFGKIKTREFFVELMKNVYGGFDVNSISPKPKVSDEKNNIQNS